MHRSPRIRSGRRRIEYVTALQSGDCGQLAETIHTQNYVTAKTVADPSTGDCQTRRGGYLGGRGSRRHRPVRAQRHRRLVKFGPGQFADFEFVLDADKGDALKQISHDLRRLDRPLQAADRRQRRRRQDRRLRGGDPRQRFRGSERDSDRRNGCPLARAASPRRGRSRRSATTRITRRRSSATSAPIRTRSRCGSARTRSGRPTCSTPPATTTPAGHPPTGIADEYGVNAYWVLPAAQPANSTGGTGTGRLGPGHANHAPPKAPVRAPAAIVAAIFFFGAVALAAGGSAPKPTGGFLDPHDSHFETPPTCR